MSPLSKIFYTIILGTCSLGFYIMAVGTKELAIDVISLILQLLTLTVLIALWAPKPLGTTALKTLGLTLGCTLLMLLLTSLIFVASPEIQNSHSLLLLIQTTLAFANIGLPAIIYGLRR
jgi:hypothetical protein